MLGKVDSALLSEYVLQNFGDMSHLKLQKLLYYTQAYHLANTRVNFNASLIGGIPETQEVVTYCPDHKVLPQIQVIKAAEVNDAWAKVLDKKARYRFVIDTATI
ncbi:alcohol dehydrogenase (NADP+)/uncharacterized zinc-type alcohol dehydrogenase-like protein [Dyadobacter soli]|uniref:Alcohol dehydrogenase (NADP+)/uncharacterized zinc-type alcohol dehydrogenase-like protein n=2 Tax=Dyadobacter soli TaxID=659014 RepID=A0A1G7M002_9BACT|nr:alcohol dehydrogenase (NADP+)/uncharacterized zinc-type alcohol dehydrogenase-like protein [Dyadobacter soli]